jgi:pilus assembly protein CpaB
MNPSRIVIIVVAGVAALLLALLVRGMIAKPAAPPAAAVAPAQTMTRVLTAKVNLAVGDRLSPDNMTWQPWPSDTLNAAYVTDGAAAPAGDSGAKAAMDKAGKTINDIANSGGPKLQAMVGDIVRDPIYAGEPITAAKIVHSGDSSYMAVRLSPGMRAIAVPVSTQTGAGGFIEPGDRIDILVSHTDTAKTSDSSANLMITQTVLSNVKVLAVDQTTDQPKGSNSAPGAQTLTLEVPQSDVALLIEAKNIGTLSMALRSYADIAGGPNSMGGPSHAVRIFKGGAPAEVTAQ